MNWAGFGMYEFGGGSGVVTGSGTTNFLARWTSATTLGDGIVQDNGTTTGVGTAPVATSYMKFASNTAGISSLNLTPSAAVDVATPVTGDMWWNGTNLYFYNGSSNIDLLAADTSIYSTNGSLTGNRTLTGAGFSLNMTGLSGYSLSATGGGIGFVDNDTTAVAQFYGLGSAFGGGFMNMLFNDAASGGGGQSLEFGGSLGIGGTGMFFLDTADSAGVKYVSDYSTAGIANYGNRWIPDYGAVLAAVTSGTTITDDRIPRGTGTGIEDGTWTNVGNDLIPVTNGSNIGSGSAGIGTLYMSSTIDYTSALNFVNSATTHITFGTDGSAIFNVAQNATADFNVKGDTEANLFFVDVSTDRVGINTNAPTVDFEVHGVSCFLEGTTTKAFGVLPDAMYVEYNAGTTLPGTPFQGATFGGALGTVAASDSTTQIIGAAAGALWNQTTPGFALNKTAGMIGLVTRSIVADHGTVAEAAGVVSKVTTNTANGTITVGVGLKTEVDTLNVGTVDNFYGVYVPDQSSTTGAPVAAQRWGIYQADAGVNYFNGAVGIKTTTPQYSLHVETGDAYVKAGVVGIGESPDSTTLLRATSDGTEVVGIRSDMSYTIETGTYSGVMVRSTTPKSGATSTLLGVNSLLTGSASAGTHSNFAGSFRANTTTGGTATVENIGARFEASGGDTNYGMQFQDGTEGLNKVLAMVTADGKINAVDPNTLVTTPTLSAVLTAGNTTGGTNIIVTSGDKIVSSSGGMEIDLRYGGIDGDYFFGADPVGFTGNWINGYSGGFGFDGNYLGNNDQAIAIKPQLNQGFQYDAPITVIKQSALGVHYGPISFNQSPVFISTTGSRLSAGQTNTVIAGGNSIIATKSQSLYANKLILQSPNNTHDAIFDIIANPLTAERTYTFQDASGTVAFLSDIPAVSYQEAFTTILTDSSGTWVSRQLAGSPNKVVHIQICTTTNNATVGVRASGSALSRTCFIDGDSGLVVPVQTDGLGNFEIFCDAVGVDFENIGEFN